MIAHYLLSTDVDYGDLQISTIFNSFKDGKNIILMVLAETIKNLNHVYEHPDSVFTRSPLLLQMWLLDHLGLLVIPPTIHNYNSNHYQAHTLVRHTDTKNEWIAWMLELSWMDIK